MSLFKKKTNDTENQKPKTKKTFKMRYVVLPLVALVVIYVVASSVIAANTPLAVASTNPATEDVLKTIETSGTISSDDIRTYFAPVEGTVLKVNYELGDVVSAADIIYVYDEEALDNSIKAAELRLSASNNTYGNSVDKTNENIEKNAKATEQIEGIEKRIKELEQKSDELQFGINQRTNELSVEEAATDKKLVEWNNELKDVQENIAGYKTMLAEEKANKSAAEAGTLSKKELASLAANKNLEALTDETTIDSYKSVKGGIATEISGIVTDVKCVDGMSVMKGTEILTIANSDNLYVSFNLSKADAAEVKEGTKVDVTFGDNKYEGIVSKINKVASKNESGSTVVGARVAITNADTNLILGAEAKLKLYVAEEKSAMTIPNACLCYDADGAFVYVIEDGMVAMKHITPGINNDFVSVVKDGLAATDMVITENTDTLIEGQPVTAITETVGE